VRESDRPLHVWVSESGERNSASSCYLVFQFFESTRDFFKVTCDSRAMRALPDCG